MKYLKSLAFAFFLSLVSMGGVSAQADNDPYKTVIKLPDPSPFVLGMLTGIQYGIIEGVFPPSAGIFDLINWGTERKLRELAVKGLKEYEGNENDFQANAYLGSWLGYILTSQFVQAQFQRLQGRQI